MAIGAGCLHKLDGKSFFARTAQALVAKLGEIQLLMSWTCPALFTESLEDTPQSAVQKLSPTVLLDYGF